MVLKLDEKSSGAEDLGELAGIVASDFRSAMQEIVSHRTAETGGRSNQARAVFGKHLEIDPWPVVVALELGQGRKLQEIAVSRVIFG